MQHTVKRHNLVRLYIGKMTRAVHGAEANAYDKVDLHIGNAHIF